MIHLSVGKYTGLSNYVERFNATLRNYLGCFTRKTLSFSKRKGNHEAVLHMFLLKYNQDRHLVKNAFARLKYFRAIAFDLIN